MFKPLLRTLPSISGNVKIVCLLEDLKESENVNNYDCYVRSAKLAPLSSNLFTKYLSISLINSSYEWDLKDFYGYYSDIFWEDHFNFNKYDLPIFDRHNVNHTRNTNFEYGCKRVSYQKNNYQLGFYAPIYIDNVNDIPDKFVIELSIKNDIYRIDKKINVNIGKGKGEIGNYLYEYLSTYLKKIDDNVIYINTNNKNANYYGIDVKNGGFSCKTDNEVNKIFAKQNTIQNFDNNLCLGFKRTNLVIKQVIPLCFYFNINDLFTDVTEYKKFINSIVYIKGHWENNGNIVSFYDWNSEYKDFNLSIKKLNTETGNINLVHDSSKNIMDFGFPSLNEGKYIHYRLSNIFNTNYSRWKLKYSSDEDPYIINMSPAFSMNQYSDTKYGQYPINYKFIEGLVDKIKDNKHISHNNLVLPIKIDNRKKYYKFNNVDTYDYYLNNYITNWYTLVNMNKYNTIYDLIKDVNFVDVTDNKTFCNGIFYNFSNIYNNENAHFGNNNVIDKFAVLLTLNYNPVEYKDIDKLLFASNTFVDKINKDANIPNVNTYLGKNLGIFMNNINRKLYNLDNKINNNELRHNEIFVRNENYTGKFINGMDYGIDYNNLMNYYMYDEIYDFFISAKPDKDGNIVEYYELVEFIKYYCNQHLIKVISESYKDYLEKYIDNNQIKCIINEILDKSEKEELKNKIFYDYNSNVKLNVKFTKTNDKNEENVIMNYTGNGFISKTDKNPSTIDVVKTELTKQLNELLLNKELFNNDWLPTICKSNIFTLNLSNYLSEQYKILGLYDFSNNFIKKKNGENVHTGTISYSFYFTLLNKYLDKNGVSSDSSNVSGGITNRDNNMFYTYKLYYSTTNDLTKISLNNHNNIGNVIDIYNSNTKNKTNNVFLYQKSKYISQSDLVDEILYKIAIEFNKLYLEELANYNNIIWEFNNGFNIMASNRPSMSHTIKFETYELTKTKLFEYLNDKNNIYKVLLDYIYQKSYKDKSFTRYTFNILKSNSKNELILNSYLEESEDLNCNFYGDTLPEDKQVYDHDVIYVDPYNLNILISEYNNNNFVKYAYINSNSVDQNIIQTYNGNYFNFNINNTIEHYCKFFNFNHFKLYLFKLYNNANLNLDYSVTNNLFIFDTIYVRKKVSYCDKFYEGYTNIKVSDMYVPISEYFIIDINYLENSGDAIYKLKNDLLNNIKAITLDKNEQNNKNLINEDFYFNRYITVGESFVNYVKTLSKNEIGEEKHNYILNILDNLTNEIKHKVLKFNYKGNVTEEWFEEINTGNEYVNSISYVIKEDKYKYLIKDEYLGVNNTVGNSTQSDFTDFTSFTFNLCFKKTFVKVNKEIMNLINLNGTLEKYVDLYLYELENKEKYSNKIYLIENYTDSKKYISNTNVCLHPLYNSIYMEKKYNTVIYDVFNSNLINTVSVVNKENKKVNEYYRNNKNNILCMIDLSELSYYNTDGILININGKKYYSYSYYLENYDNIMNSNDPSDGNDLYSITIDEIKEVLGQQLYYDRDFTKDYIYWYSIPEINAYNKTTYNYVKVDGSQLSLDVLKTNNITYEEINMGGDEEEGTYMVYKVNSFPENTIVENPRYRYFISKKIDLSGNHTFFENTFDFYEKINLNFKNSYLNYLKTDELEQLLSSDNFTRKETINYNYYDQNGFDELKLNKKFDIDKSQYEYYFDYETLNYTYRIPNIEVSYVLNNIDSQNIIYDSSYVLGYIDNLGLYDKYKLNTYTYIDENNNKVNYGFYLIELTLNNTKNTLNLYDEYNNAIKYITYINGTKIDNTNGNYIYDIFNMLVPFVKTNIFSEFLNSDKYHSIITPNKYEFPIHYKSLPLNNNDLSNYYDIKFSKHALNTNKLICERYFDQIVPLLLPVSSINLFSLKYKNINKTFDYSYDNEIYSHSIESIYNNPGIKLYNLSESNTDFTIIKDYEYKYFNDNCFYNLEEEIIIDMKEYYSYAELIYMKSIEKTIEIFKKYLISNTNINFNDDEILFLYNKYSVKYLSNSDELFYDKKTLRYKLTYKFSLL